MISRDIRWSLICSPFMLHADVDNDSHPACPPPSPPSSIRVKNGKALAEYESFEPEGDEEDHMIGV